MRFASLSSGSQGNAWLVAHESTLLLIDCGINLAGLAARMARLGCALDDLSAVFITHEHSDHAKGLSSLRKKIPDLPVYASYGSAYALKIENFQPLRDDHEVAINAAIIATAFTVPHDANEPLQFRFRAGTGEGARHCAILTDLGHPHRQLIERLDRLHALALEFNHDRELLRSGHYPPWLKSRVGGDYGHLSNDQSCALLRQLSIGSMRHIVAAHLSEHNNHPQKVHDQLRQLITEGGSSAQIHIAPQHATSDWMEV